MPSNIEHGQAFALSGTEKDGTTESAAEVNLELRTNQYWHKFGFPGNPPRPGSPVFERLIKYCQDYEHYVSDPRLQGATGWEGGRRQIHEQLANMIFGRNLGSLTPDMRENTTEFACLVSTGLDSHQLGELATYQKIEEY